jgi:hypothetical protein
MTWRIPERAIAAVETAPAMRLRLLSSITSSSSSSLSRPLRSTVCVYAASCAGHWLADYSQAPSTHRQDLAVLRYTRVGELALGDADEELMQAAPVVARPPAVRPRVVLVSPDRMLPPGEVGGHLRLHQHLPSTVCGCCSSYTPSG